MFLRGIRERAGDTWYPYRHHYLIEAKQSDETNKREGMRAPFPLRLPLPSLSPLPCSASSRLHRERRFVPLPLLLLQTPVLPRPSPAILLFRSRKIEYLCKLNGGGIDGRPGKSKRWEGRIITWFVSTWVTIRRGRSNLAKNFRMSSGRTRSRWLIKLTED